MRLRSFKHIAEFIRVKRLSHPKHYSQFEFSILLGYKNGQFISNVEQGKCSIPFKHIAKISEVLEVPSEEIKLALLRDYGATIDNHLKSQNQSNPSTSFNL